MSKKDTWSVEDSEALYGIRQWGTGFFSAAKNGNLVVTPRDGTAGTIDMFTLVDDLALRGVDLPIVLRFDDILRSQIKRINTAFSDAIAEFGYENRYRLAFPIKVNQQRQVIDSVREAGRESGIALEVGSKPELMALLAIHNEPGGMLLCNGYKDTEYIELALLSKRLGLRPIIVIEQFYELDLVLQASEALGITPEIGLRMKPLTRASGRWENSAGEAAKFGLTSWEMMQAIQDTRRAGKPEMVKLLHCHAGSQMFSIVDLKRVLREVTRTYVEVARLCPDMQFLDVGGGLAVDYDGTQSQSQNSRDYSLSEYARDVVWATQQACRTAGIPVPEIISESGRATVAHHAVLVTSVSDVSAGMPQTAVPEPTENAHRVVGDLLELVHGVTSANLVETFHDSLSYREEMVTLYLQGQLSLEDRATGDLAFRLLVKRMLELKNGARHFPEELLRFEGLLRDIYFCNFSVFQSLPDSWAISQLFPIAPIHRLNEQPTAQGVIADITCDSDGKIGSFATCEGTVEALPLHTSDGPEPYYLGIFLVGAYQETLGDLHNLFGDANVVHVTMKDNGEPDIREIVEGDTVREVLSYVQYEPEYLMERFNANLGRAFSEELLSREQFADFRKRFRLGLEGYTYLVKG